FYVRQVLGFIIIAMVTSWIPFVNIVMWLVLLVAWIMSLVAALGGQMKPTFLLGKQFQEWFKGI
ncbi:YtxH domain-containing protein, partial [Winogradskyella litoriviva]|nr:YtxH domain-containing protein [Winogradskyella litoriviva]